MNRTTRIQVWILFGLILANFVAQIVYFFHLYYSPQHPFPELRSFLLLGSVFALFLLGFTLFMQHRQLGFYLLTLFLALEFGFYVLNLLGGAIRGPGLFFHLREPDPILWLVFLLGYINLLASGYFLFLLLKNRKTWLRKAAA